MVHEVLAYASQLQNRWDTMLLQLSRRSNTRPQEDGRTAVRATAKDDFFARIVDLRFSRAILHNDTGSPQLASLRLLNENPINRTTSENGNILTLEPIRDEIRTGRPQALIHRPRHMSTSMRRIPRREHIRHKRETGRDKRREDKLRDRRRIMRFSVQRARIAMVVGTSLEPRLGMEGFGLFHAREYFLAAPAG